MCQRMGFGFFPFFSAILPDSQPLQEASTRLNYLQGSGQMWLLGAALCLRRAALLLGCDGAIPAVLGVNQTSTSPWLQESTFQGNSRNTWNASVY